MKTGWAADHHRVECQCDDCCGSDAMETLTQAQIDLIPKLYDACVSTALTRHGRHGDAHPIDAFWLLVQFMAEEPIHILELHRHFVAYGRERAHETIWSKESWQ
jgi:hypothetical protein